MASTYTSNNGIEKPGTGDQSGTWGTTTNINFDIIDQAISGQVSIAITGNKLLQTSNGSTSDGLNPVLVLTGTPGSAFELQIDPTDAKKLYFIQNDTDATCTVVYNGVTASGSNSVEIPAGLFKICSGDGGGGSGVFIELNPSQVSLDTSPELGGDLDVSGNSIVSSSNGDIAITPNGTGDVIIDGIKYPQTDGSANQVLITDGSAQLSFASIDSGTLRTVPAGVIVPYAGATAPTGWLLCYGQAVASATYGDLYAAITTTYGGDATNFNLPDLRGRVVAGQDDMGGVSADRLTSPVNGDSLGAAGGSESHTLAITEIPDHNHFIGSNSRVQMGLDNGTTYAGYSPSQYSATNTFTQGVRTTSNGTTSTGGSHNNVQPTFILNYIIKT